MNSGALFTVFQLIFSLFAFLLLALVLASLFGLILRLVISKLGLRFHERELPISKQKVLFSKSELLATFPYQKKTTLFSPAERSFLGVLDQVISNDYRIFGQVRLADVIQTRDDVSPKLKQLAFNRISRKHVDFVICRKDTLKIELLIELDDRSHEAPLRKKRDTFFNQAIRFAGIPLLRIPVQEAYSLMELAEKIEEATKGYQ